MHESVKVFFSYSHKDEAFRDELVEHLSSLQQRGIISIWHDGKIQPGMNWDDITKAQLNAADIILLLISSSFMASRDKYEVEIRHAIQRHEAKAARVIPVILRSYDWESTPFGRLKALPAGGKPVTKWDDRDEAFVSIVKGIQAVAEELTSSPLQSLQNYEQVQSKTFTTFSPTTFPQHRFDLIEPRPLAEAPYALSAEGKRSSNYRRNEPYFPWCGMAKTFLAYSVIGFISTKISTPPLGIALVVVWALVGALTGTTLITAGVAFALPIGMALTRYYGYVVVGWLAGVIAFLGWLFVVGWLVEFTGFKSKQILKFGFFGYLFSAGITLLGLALGWLVYSVFFMK